MRILPVALIACIAGTAFAADSPSLPTQFHDTVQPFVGQYCATCHSGAQPSGQFDLKSYASVEQVKEEYTRWALLADRLAAKEMPPKKAPQPPPEAARQVIDWVRSVRADEIKRLGGDPGVVLARRLSNAEYDNSIRDLTGQDLHVTAQFPVDPANTAGFQNSGESLTLSPALLNKYLQAARRVADTMMLEPDGIDFAPYSAQAITDRERYYVQSIVDFYKAQPTDFAQYFQAAWRYRYRKVLGHPGATLASTAADAKLSPKYLPLVWGILHDKGVIGPGAELRKMWQDLPAPTSAHPPAAQMRELQDRSVAMRQYVVRIRAHTAMQFAAPLVKGLATQSEPLFTWKLAQYAAHHRDSDPNDLRADTDPKPSLPAIPDYPRLYEDGAPRWAIMAAHARADDPDLVYPHGQKARYQAAFERFARVFPDIFYVSERGRYWPDDSEDKDRLLSAGYHTALGFFRDDTALMQLVLDEKDQRKLDRMWHDFDFVADQTARTWTQFYLTFSAEVLPRNGRAGSQGASPPPVGHAITDSAVILHYRDLYLAKFAEDKSNDPVAKQAILAHFAHFNATIRNMERERAATQPKQLVALVDFADRAYRRPLSADELADILAYYQSLRDKSGLSHEDAVRQTLVSILVSPQFLYRVDLVNAAAPAAHAGLVKAAHVTGKAFASAPLSSYALASQLSYFIWASTPDAELLRHAMAGDLQKPQVLLAQARRMLKDPKISGLATEFTGNWLAFRQFQTNNTVDRARFPAFDENLREAMFQEPIRVMQDNIQNDRSVLDLIYADYTFVNAPLARHYGMPEVIGDASHWVRVDNASKYGRGGILPMAVFMTQYSPGLRTSPVQRGHWVVSKVLGMAIPPPPPVVPELPSDESKTELPIRQMLEQHHKNPFCAGCHQRFDSFGLVFEGYGPVGEARSQDLAGRQVDASATFPGNVDAVGLEGLKTFIRAHRQDQFIDNLSRKLLAYALNRSLQLSDDSLIEAMKRKLAANGYRFRSLIETIVVSPQFLNRRIDGTADAPASPTPPAGGKLVKAAHRKAH